MIGRINDVRLYQSLVRQGVSEYLVSPVGALHLIEVLAGMYVAPEEAPRGKISVFVGATGGCGVTSLSDNVAWMIAEQMSRDAVLLDFDTCFGATNLNFNKDPSGGLITLFGAPDRVDDSLVERLVVKVTENLGMLAAPARIDHEYEPNAASVEALFDALRLHTGTFGR